MKVQLKNIKLSEINTENFQKEYFIPSENYFKKKKKRSKFSHHSLIIILKDHLKQLEMIKLKIKNANEQPEFH